VPVIQCATFRCLVEMSIAAAVGAPALDYEQIIKGQARGGAEKEDEECCNQTQRKEQLRHCSPRAQEGPKIKSRWT
jgi:hypothetical protein